jgi:chaperone BCS1
MRKIIKKTLEDLAVKAIKDTIIESGIIPLVKESVKNSLLNTVKITEEENSVLYREIEKFLIGKYLNRFQNLNTYVDLGIHEDMPVDNQNRELLFVKYGIENGKTLIKENGIYIWVSKSNPPKEEINVINYGRAPRKNAIILTTLKKDKEKLLEFIMNLADESYKAKIKQSLVEMYIVDEGYWTCFKKTKPIALDDIILPHEIKNDLITDFDKFINKRDWYSEMGLSFKRGYLLYGAPRNGKSSLITAMARKYGMNVYYLNLNALASDGDLMKLFTRIPNNSIVAVEDIDTVWEKRDAKKANCKINIETFMNLLSGSYERDGLIFFFTTNYIENLDEALIGDRRIDKKIHIENPKKEQVEEYLTKLYGVNFELKTYR